MSVTLKLEGRRIDGARFGRALEKTITKAVEKAFRSEGFRLKQEMSQDIKANRMSWAPVSPYTLALRKRFRRDKAPGRFFAQFVRYAVEGEGENLRLRVGVLNAPGIKPLSRGILARSEKFATGFQFTATEKYRKARIKAFLASRGIDDWSSLSKRRKRALKRMMTKLGVFVRKGTTIKAPPRPADPFLEKQRARIRKELDWLLDRALKGEKWSKSWWEEVRF